MPKKTQRTDAPCSGTRITRHERKQRHGNLFGEQPKKVPRGIGAKCNRDERPLGGQFSGRPHWLQMRFLNVSITKGIQQSGRQKSKRTMNRINPPWVSPEAVVGVSCLQVGQYIAYSLFAVVSSSRGKHRQNHVIPQETLRQRGNRIPATRRKRLRCLGRTLFFHKSEVPPCASGFRFRLMVQRKVYPRTPVGKRKNNRE